MLHLRISERATTLNRYRAACGVQVADTYCTDNVEHVNCEECEARIREHLRAQVDRIDPMPELGITETPPVLREEHSTEELLSLARKCDEVAIREGGHEPTYALAAANGYRLRVLLLSLGITIHTPRIRPEHPRGDGELDPRESAAGSFQDYERHAARAIRGPGREPYRPPEIATDEQAAPLENVCRRCGKYLIEPGPLCECHLDPCFRCSHPRQTHPRGALRCIVKPGDVWADKTIDKFCTCPEFVEPEPAPRFATDVCDRCGHERHRHVSVVGVAMGCEVENPIGGTDGVESRICMCIRFIERDQLPNPSWKTNSPT